MNVIASRYIQGACHELVHLPSRPHHKWIVAVNGGIPDARQKLTLVEAQVWYDRASRTYGPRPASALERRSALAERSEP